MRCGTPLAQICCARGGVVMCGGLGWWRRWWWVTVLDDAMKPSFTFTCHRHGSTVTVTHYHESTNDDIITTTSPTSHKTHNSQVSHMSQSQCHCCTTSPTGHESPTTTATEQKRVAVCCCVFVVACVACQRTSARARFSNTPAAFSKLPHRTYCCVSASLKLSPSSSRIMASASFWSDACKNAIGRSVQSFQDALYASGSVTVRPIRAAAWRVCC